MNKDHNSYEDESPLSYDNYAARQRMDKWESKKAPPQEESSDLDEAEGLAEALLWCAVLMAVIFCGALMLTN